MKSNRQQRRKVITLLELAVIPAVILIGIVFHLSQAFIVPLALTLALLLGAAALWARANKDADGSEWWQDDDPSGWRGY